MSNQSGKRVLVTRPQEDAASVAGALRQRGFDPVIEPLMTIEPTDAEVPALDGCRALLLTSANGVRAFAAKSDRRDLAVFAVGPATASTAREAGFTEIDQAAGDVTALAARVRAVLTPGDGWLLHVAGATVAGDLAGQLGEAGFRVNRVALYRAVAAEALSEPTVEAIRAGAIGHVLLFSPRTAEIFVDLIRRAKLDQPIRSVTALCLSQAVADAAALPFAARRIAATPDQAALLMLLPVAAAKPASGSARQRRPLLIPALALGGTVAALGIGAYLVSGQGQMDWSIDRQTAARSPASMPSTAPTPTPAAAQDRVAAATDRLDSLEKDVLAVRRQVAKINATSLDEIQRRIAELENRLGQPGGSNSPSAASGASNSSAGTDLAALADRLGDRLSHLEARLDQTDARQVTAATASEQRASLGLAVAQLSEAVRRGEPYLEPLAMVGRLAGDPAHGLIATLEPSAATGLPTLDRLVERFPDLARDAKAAAIAGEAQGWLGVVNTFLARLIVIRATDGSGDFDAALAEAERRLAARDLGGALDAVSILGGPGAIVLAEWRRDAEQRRDVERALNALSLQAIGALGQRAG